MKIKTKLSSANILAETYKQTDKTNPAKDRKSNTTTRWLCTPESNRTGGQEQLAVGWPADLDLRFWCCSFTTFPKTLNLSASPLSHKFDEFATPVLCISPGDEDLYFNESTLSKSNEWPMSGMFTLLKLSCKN